MEDKLKNTLLLGILTIESISIIIIFMIAFYKIHQHNNKNYNSNKKVEINHGYKRSIH